MRRWIWSSHESHNPVILRNISSNALDQYKVNYTKCFAEPRERRGCSGVCSNLAMGHITKPLTRSRIKNGRIDRRPGDKSGGLCDALGFLVKGCTPHQLSDFLRHACRASINACQLIVYTNFAENDGKI